MIALAFIVGVCCGLAAAVPVLRWTARQSVSAVDAAIKLCISAAPNDAWRMRAALRAYNRLTAEQRVALLRQLEEA